MSSEKHDPVALAHAYGLAGYAQSAAPVKEDVNSSVALARAYGLEGFAEVDEQAEGERDAVVDLAQAYGLAGFTPSGAAEAAAPTPSTATASEEPRPVPTAAPVGTADSGAQVEVSEEVLDAARAALAETGSANEACIRLLQKASTSQAFRDLLAAPSPSARRATSSCLGVAHRDAAKRAVAIVEGNR